VKYSKITGKGAGEIPMANSYFKFKQFTIHQDKCAMKVCTDACLFGALIANCPTCLHKGRLAIVNCLEIGTGTGLLSLMLAQKNNTIKIDAVEIDAPAAEQATENIAASPWAGNIQVFNEDILTFSPTEGKKYDCIISNPPFFEDDLQSADKAKNNAKHNTALNLLQLLQVVDNYLATDGFFAVLLPYHRVGYFIEESVKMGLHLNKLVLVKQTIKHKFFRGILFFNRKNTEPEYNEIIIKDSNHNYTPAFSAALRDYYLFL
jgi:tRNA1Val (adenine37-N6)-methyltransferase